MRALRFNDYESKGYYACIGVLLTVSYIEETLDVLNLEVASPDVFAVVKSALAGFVGMAYSKSGLLLPRIMGELCLLSSLEITLLVGHKRFDFQHFLKHVEGFVIGSTAYMLLPDHLKKQVREALLSFS